MSDSAATHELFGLWQAFLGRHEDSQNGGNIMRLGLKKEE